MRVFRILLWPLALVCTAWAVGAVAFDFPWVSLRNVAAVLYASSMVVLLIFLHGGWRKLTALFAGFAVVLVWWLTLQPTNKAAWQPDVSQTARADIDDDTVTLHNVRNFEYRSLTDFTPRWETRTVRLSQITGMDIAINYWGSPYMAHPIVSFQFADSAQTAPVCFSIETRFKIGQSYSAIGGLYRQYELIYVVANERDVIRLRTNYRKGEDVYLYRTTATPEQARERFLEYLRGLNYLHKNPRWYNAVTTNCTTTIRLQRKPQERAPWDWRMLVNGFGDEMLYENKGIVTNGLTFAELKRRALINARAQAADDAPDFSLRIRQP